MQSNIIDLSKERAERRDYMVRAIARGGEIRAFAATTRNLVQEASDIHETLPLATAALGRGLTAGVIMGDLQKSEDELLTLIFKGDGPLGGMTITANSKGHVKGFIYHTKVELPPKSKGHLDVGRGFGKGMLTVVRDQGMKEPYSSSIPLYSGEVAEDLTHYFAESEQVPSSVGLGVLVGTDGRVRQAGGFLIQLMPGFSDETLDHLEANLSKASSVTQMLEQGMTPEEMLKNLIPEDDLEILEEKNVGFVCDCSRERVARALMTVGKKELQEMISEEKPVELQCHFCKKTYSFSTGELRQMLNSL